MGDFSFDLFVENSHNSAPGSAFILKDSMSSNPWISITLHPWGLPIKSINNSSLPWLKYQLSIKKKQLKFMHGKYELLFTACKTLLRECILVQSWYWEYLKVISKKLMSPKYSSSKYINCNSDEAHMLTINLSMFISLILLSLTQEKFRWKRTTWRKAYRAVSYILASYNMVS